METPPDVFEEEGYALEELLLADGWGQLYRARYRPHAREVLLRRFPDGLAVDASAWELAAAEIQAWARLSGPGVMRVLDWGLSRAGAFLATELPAGAPLARILPETQGVENGAEILGAAASAVESARRWGVLHLGLGPSNIWLCDDGRVMVAGFGLWYVARDFPGTLEPDEKFLAPEQLTGGKVSAATDVFTLGLLYMALRFGLEAATEAAAGSMYPEEAGEMRGPLARSLDPRPLARQRTAGDLAGELGLAHDGAGDTELRSCPLCRLREELQREAGLGRKKGAGPRAEPTVSIAYPWLIAAALAATALLVWWFALR